MGVGSIGKGKVQGKGVSKRVEKGKKHNVRDE